MSIGPTLLKRIEQLLAEGGLPQQVIADRVGVNATVVSQISRGVHALQRNPRPEMITERPQSKAWRGITPPANFVDTCPTCRRNVKMPCLACQLRERNVIA